jgi:hypothetical protein
MRQVTMAALLVSILAFTMRCSDKEPLTNLGGTTQVAAAAVVDSFYFLRQNDGSLDSSILRTDSIRWLYMFPTGGSSSTSLIISGSIRGKGSIDSLDTMVMKSTDLEVETYTGSVPGIVRIAYDSMGVFSDTVPITASRQSGVILPPQNSRLFVRRIYKVFSIDTMKVADTLHVPDSLQVFDTLSARDTIQVLDTIPLANPW